MDDPDLDPMKTVDAYRDVIARLDLATDEPDKAEFLAIAQRLRDRWKAWQGEDSLHEMAFGEPVE